MVISVQCPSCSTSFPVDTAKVPEGGVYARCSVCSGVFFVEGPRAGVAEVPVASHGSLPNEPRAAEPWSPPAPGPWSAAAPSSFEVATEPPDAPPAEETSYPQILEAGVADAGVMHAGSSPESHTQDAVPSGGFEGAFGVEETPSTPPSEGANTSSGPAGAFTFGRRDPHDKARRLARVLVSDMIMYNPERHSRAIATGSLREDFDDEIKKSWEEYVDQVGEEIAKGTSYFDDALNEILARGERVFP